MIRLQSILLVVGFEEAIHLLQNLPIHGPNEGAHAVDGQAILEAQTQPHAQSHQLVEAQLLDTMSRVKLPEELFDRLLSHSIMHGPS